MKYHIIRSQIPGKPYIVYNESGLIEGEFYKEIDALRLKSELEGETMTKPRTVEEIDEDILGWQNHIEYAKKSITALYQERATISRSKSKNREDSKKKLEKSAMDKFRPIVVPGMFVRVVGARTYNWKCVTERGYGNYGFYHKGVCILKTGPELRPSSASYTGYEKIRECLTKEQFEERFGAIKNL